MKSLRHLVAVVLIITAVVFAAIGLMVDMARAEEVSIKGNNKDKVQGRCAGEGDVFWQGRYLRLPPCRR